MKLRNSKIKCRIKYLKIWDEEIKVIIEEKHKAYKKWLHYEILEMT
jgi:hypothetical protein